NVVFDRAVLGAADADAAAAARVGGTAGLVLGLRIGDVEHVVFVDIDRARPTELRPLGDELAVLVENLDAAVRAVGDKDAPLTVQRDAVRHVELAGSLALLAPGLQHLAVGRELDDAGVRARAVPVGDKDRAVGRD